MGALFFYAHPAFCEAGKPADAAIDTVNVKDVYVFSDTTEKKDTVIINATLLEPTDEDFELAFKKHSPHKATIYSAVLPGLGQVYNRKYWKVPIIYATGIFFYNGFGLDWGWKYYNDAYKEFREIYQTEYNKGSEKDEAKMNQANLFMSIAREKRDKIVIWMGIFYFANIIDAMTDAYFYSYDISDDLSMQLVPGISTTEQYASVHDYSYGFKLKLKF